MRDKAGSGRQAPVSLFAPVRVWRALESRPIGQRRLYFGRARSTGASLVRRALLVAALVAAVVVVFALDRNGLRDSVDGHVSIADVVYFALITITTVGYGDIVPVTQTARLVDAFVVTPIRVVVWAIFFGTAYQFIAQRIIEDIRMRVRQASLKGHVVICGFGHGGRSAAGELVRRGEDPARIVVIDQSESALLDAAEGGMVGLRGDATRESVLHDANVGNARSAIVCLGRDDTTVLSVLTIRTLVSDLRVVAVVKDAENEHLVQQSGASATICPSTVSGVLLANSLTSSRIASYVYDMLTVDGRVTLSERVATGDDIGRRPADLASGIALRIHRGEQVIGFWEPDARVQAGDRLIVLAPRPGAGRSDATAAPPNRHPGTRDGLAR